MTTKRLALGVATGVLVLGVGAGVYATAQNTNQDPRSFSRGMGPGVAPADAAGPSDSAQGRRGGPGGPMGMLPMLGRELNITDAQKAQIKTIADSHRDERKALGDRARIAHDALQQAVTADSVDEGLIRQRSAEVAAVEATWPSPAPSDARRGVPAADAGTEDPGENAAVYARGADAANVVQDAGR